MKYPSFYDAVEPIILHDPLAQFLGALGEGSVQITYLDCVKLAGHSCPTVAGAYLMTRYALQKLYPGQPPLRSGIKLDVRATKEEGVAGVTGNVAGYIIGAGDTGGFKGIAGKFSRADLVNYGVDIDGDIRLTRLDIAESVTVSYDPSAVPADEQMKPLMRLLLGQGGSQAQQEQFAAMWQERTRKILLETPMDDIITIHEEIQ
jgi:hypothetical protein